MAIDIGPGATDRNSTRTAAITRICLANPANATGVLTSFECWFNSGAAGVKIGTFSGGGTTYTNRDVEAIGNVTAGSKQTFSGLSCDVTTGDFVGYYCASGDIESSTSGGSGLPYKSGDQFGTGSQTYSAYVGSDASLYGTGTEIAGPATIGKINGSAANTIGKKDGSTYTTLGKVDGSA